MMMNDNDYLRYMMIPIMTRNIWSMFSAALVFHSSRPFAVNSRRSIAFVRFIKSVDILLPAQLLFAPGIIPRYIITVCQGLLCVLYRTQGHGWVTMTRIHWLFPPSVYAIEYFYFQDQTLKLSRIKQHHHLTVKISILNIPSGHEIFPCKLPVEWVWSWPSYGRCSFD